MSFHLGAKDGEIAETVLLPGDPLRAKYIAEKYLNNVVNYTTVRGMLGFTGDYNGKKISVQGTGMGIPSISIYVTELIKDYGCKNLIRIGSCGSIQEHVNVRDIILAIGASTDSNVNKLVFRGMDFSATANFDLLLKAHTSAKSNDVKCHVGNILTSDSFYNYDRDFYKVWKDFGVLAVEMEANALYSICSNYGVNALTILTVSDNVLTGEATSSEEREKTFHDMMEIALSLA